MTAELLQMPIGGELVVNGSAVRRISNSEYEYKSDICTIEQLTAILDKQPIASLALLFVVPHTTTVTRVVPFTSKSILTKAISEAKAQQLYLYYARVVKSEGKYQAIQPRTIEFESVPDQLSATPSVSEFQCPYCRKVLNSTYGRTNHIKGRHPEQFAAYRQQYQSVQT